MELRPLGQTGLRVSALGLGTVKLGRVQGLKYPSAFELPSDAEAAALLDHAAALGITLIDTAPAYGTSEERLGALLAAGAGGGRSRWVVCTKAGEEFEATADGRGASRFDFSPRAVRASVERSLRRLRTDVLDVVLLHSDGRDEEVIERSGGLEELVRLKREGKVRASGISTKTPAGAMKAIARGAGGGGVDVLMVTYNPREAADGPAIDAAAARGIGVLVKKALLSGHATGLADPDPVRACLRFALDKPGVSSVVVGTISRSHVSANAAATARNT